MRKIDDCDVLCTWDDGALYFYAHDGSYSVVWQQYTPDGSLFREAIAAEDDLIDLIDYPSHDDTLPPERMQFLFGNERGYMHFVELCKKNNVAVKEYRW